MHTFIAPDSLLYIVVKLCVLLGAILAWWLLFTPKVV